MIKKQSLSKNFVYQFVYQGLILFLPLILSPYLTRVLRETSLGVYSYVNSIAFYFVTLSNLGISRYGQRLVSQTETGSNSMRTNFWSLYCIHVIISIASFCCYILYFSFIATNYKDVYLIQSLYVLSALFDITWLFYGLENFRSVVLKNTIVKLLECFAIFAFVKNEKDILIYTFITAFGTLCGQIVMLPQAIKIIKPIKIHLFDIKKHIKPLVVFSVAVIGATLYTVFDKTLLGILSSVENVAFYEYSNRIISAPKTLVTVIGVVMFPRACRFVKEADLDSQRKYMKLSYKMCSLISFGAIFGIIAVSDSFALEYFGEPFLICGRVMSILCPIIFIIGIGDIIRTQYMYPNGMEKICTISIIFNAVINLIISAILIPSLGIYGAVAGTISAELFGLIFQMYFCRSFLRLRDLISSAIPFSFFGFLMFLMIKILQQYLPGNVRGLIIEILLGALFYMLLSILYMLKSKFYEDFRKA